MLEKVLCISLIRGDSDTAKENSRRALAELAELVRAAGAQVVAEAAQTRQAPDPATYIGSGKVDEVAHQVKVDKIDLVVVNAELSGSQLRNIHDAVGCRVIDRTMLILDIFAGRAQSREGKLQVELAQQRYSLSHLTGQGIALSRLGGGIGTRGPGETQLETDRRHINRRISHLNRALRKVAQNRDRLRERRQEKSILTIAVVGYTNAGKSTLINRLCHASLHSADQMFATLDPSVRRLVLPDQSPVLLIDTVGFIRDLPHHLIEAFHSTLDEVRYADAILEIADASDPEMLTQLQVVENLLGQLKADRKPRRVVLNKIDQTPTTIQGEWDQLLGDTIRRETGGPLLAVSALSGEGLKQLISEISRLNMHGQLQLKLWIPYEDAQWLDYIRRHGKLDKVKYENEGIQAEIHIPQEFFAPLRPFLQLAQNRQER